MIAKSRAVRLRIAKSAVDVLAAGPRDIVAMSKWANRGLIVLVPAFLILIIFLIQKRRDNQMYTAYEKVATGMNLASVEELLGSSGSAINFAEVPQSPSGHVVKGDTYYEWTDESGHKIIIAFANGCVHGKWYWEPDL